MKSNETQIAASSRLAVVTGGSRGIGRGIAERMLQEGYRCLITGTTTRSEPPLRGADFFAVDFNDLQQSRDFAEYLGSIQPEILVNNAGINIKGPTDTFSDQDSESLYRVNLDAPVRLCKAVLPSMKRKGWGRIVNITSLWSVIGNANDAVYCATKFGLDGFTTALAAEVASSNILVNGVAPGYIRTEATEQAFSEDALLSWASNIPIKRLGTPKEVAALVAWLVSDENTYLTGQNILIDGGLARN